MCKLKKTQGGAMNAEPGGTSEIVGIVVAFVILLITFGSLYRSWYANY